TKQVDLYEIGNTLHESPTLAEILRPALRIDPFVRRRQDLDAGNELALRAGLVDFDVRLALLHGNGIRHRHAYLLRSWLFKHNGAGSAWAFFSSSGSFHDADIRLHGMSFAGIERRQHYIGPVRSADHVTFWNQSGESAFNFRNQLVMEIRPEAGCLDIRVHAGKR